MGVVCFYVLRLPPSRKVSACCTTYFLPTAAESKGVSLDILVQRIDTGTALGKAYFRILGVFSEFETNLRKERLGISRATVYLYR